MRILQVSTADMAGGAERIAWNLHKGIERLGHNSYLAVGMQKSDDSTVLTIPNNAYRNRKAHTLNAVTSLLVKHHLPGASLEPHIARLAELQRYKAYLAGIEDFDFPASNRLLSLPPQRPDILHAHNLHGGYFDLRTLPALSKQVPVILTLHDAWLLSGHCAHSFDCERWRTGCGNCPDLTIYPAVRRDATAYNWQRKQDIYADSRLHIATPSQWLMDKVRSSVLQAAVIEARVIPNGVDLSVFYPQDRIEARQALGLPHDAHIVLFVGYGTRNNPWKDYATMEAALQRIATRSGVQDLHFICLGEKGANKQIGSASIHFVGYTADAAMVAQYYNAADVYIHAARVDTFPNVVLEALACGTPVVATAIGGIPEQIDEGQTGFLVAPHDSVAMADRTEALLDNELLRHEMGRQAAFIARERFGMTRMVNNYVDWYHQILAGPCRYPIS